MTTVEQAPGHRDELIADLHRLADWLKAHPDVPIGPYDHVRVQYSILPSFGDKAARIAEVERVAALLGVDVKRPDGHAWAELPVGRRVTYVVNAGTDQPDMAVAR